MLSCHLPHLPASLVPSLASCSTPDLSTCPGCLLCPHLHLLCPTTPRQGMRQPRHVRHGLHRLATNGGGGDPFLLPKSCVPRKQTRMTVSFSPFMQAMSQPPNTASTFVVMVTFHPCWPSLPETLLRTLPETPCSSGALQRSPHHTVKHPTPTLLPYTSHVASSRPAQGCSADPGSWSPRPSAPSGHRRLTSPVF